MKKSLLSLLMVLSMLVGCITPVFADTTSDGKLLAENVRAFTYLASEKYGVDIIFTVPSEAPTETKVTLYNTSDNAVVTSLAQGDGLGTLNGNTNPATFTEGDFVTPGKRVAVTFNGLSNSGNYYAKIEMKNAAATGTVTVSDIKPTGYAAPLDGYSFGRLTVTHRTWNSSHDLSETAIDTENVYSGKSSLKYSSEGFCRGGGIGSRGDLQTEIFVNGISFAPSAIYEWKFAYKGDAPKSYSCSNGTVTKVSEVKDGDWTVVTHIINVLDTDNSVSPKIHMGNEIGTLTYIDAMSIKTVDSFNAETKEYTITNNENYLKGGGFETQVSNLRMDTEKVLSWTLPDNAFFAKLTIKKGDEVIGTIDGTNSYKGVTATSYTIPDADWDINATYSVTAATASGAGNLYHNAAAGKEGAPVSQTGLSEIEIKNYNGPVPADAIAANSAGGVIDVLWNMPATSLTHLRTTAELFDSDGEKVDSKVATLTSNGKNVHVKLTAGDTADIYTVKITSVYSDGSAGVAEIKNVYADATATGNDNYGTNTLKGMVFGDWYVQAKNTNGRVVYDITYDTENKKTSPASLKVDFRGVVVNKDGNEVFSDNHAGSYGSTFLLLQNSANTENDKYYEISYTYKATPRSGWNDNVAEPEFKGGANGDKNIGDTASYMPITSDGDTVTDTDDNGWKTVKALYKGDGNAFRFTVINQWSARRVFWLDNVSFKEATYNADDKTYAVTGKNLLKGGDLDFEVKNAAIDAEGYITWEETEPGIIKEVRVYEKDGDSLKLIDTVEPETCFTTIENPEKDHVIKVVTKTSNGYNVAKVETAGVTVKGVNGEDVPDKVIGTISLDKQGTNATASVDVRNNSIEDGLKATLIIAEYSGTNLVNLVTLTSTVKKGESETVSTGLTLENANNTVKAFLWKGLESVTPLTAGVSK